MLKPYCVRMRISHWHPSKLRFVYAHWKLFRRDRVFRDQTNPFDVYDEREMLERSRLGKTDLWKISDEMLGDAFEFNSARLSGTPAIVQLLLILRIWLVVDSRSTRLRRWRDVTRQMSQKRGI